MDLFNSIYQSGELVGHDDHPLFQVEIISHSHSHMYSCTGYDAKGKRFVKEIVWLAPKRTYKI